MAPKSVLTESKEQKRFDLLREIVPAATALSTACGNRGVTGDVVAQPGTAMNSCRLIHHLDKSESGMAMECSSQILCRSMNIFSD